MKSKTKDRGPVSHNWFQEKKMLGLVQESYFLSSPLGDNGLLGCPKSS